MNILLGLVLAVAFGLFWWKFVWPDMRENFRQLAASERKLGPVKFGALMAGTLAFIGLFAWLAIRLDYPAAYRHPCHGRGCMLHDIWYSPLLLRTHGWDEVTLFILFWTFPGALVAAGIYALDRKLRGTKFSLYSDDTE